MSEFAGTLRMRVSQLRRATARDPLGADEGAWSAIATVQAEVAPDGEGAAVVADALAAMPRWRVIARPFALAVGDRLHWDGTTIEVRSVRSDPRRPDRIVANGEEIR